MPTVITDNATWDNEIPAISNGDEVDEAVMNLAPQALANRTAFLNDKIDQEVTQLNGYIDHQDDALGVRIDIITPNTFLPGQVIYYAGSTLPPGWLSCDGTSKVRADYPQLYLAIGTTWGPGTDTAGGTTFSLPPLAGEFIRCLNIGDQAPLDQNRTLNRTPQTDAIQNIVGTLSIRTGGEQTGTGPFTPDPTATSGCISASVVGTVPSVKFDASRTVRTATETRPHNIALHAIIKT
jgi:microcystin-dependent protein